MLIGLPSPGLRCNGYTLARHVLLERAGLALDGPAWPGAVRLAGRRAVRAVGHLHPGGAGRHRRHRVTGRPRGPCVAHITGGGFEGNVPRALPDGTRAVLDRGTWEVPPIFGEIRRLGNVADEEMARVFNLGLGMV